MADFGIDINQIERAFAGARLGYGTYSKLLIITIAYIILIFAYGLMYLLNITDPRIHQVWKALGHVCVIGSVILGMAIFEAFLEYNYQQQHRQQIPQVSATYGDGGHYLFREDSGVGWLEEELDEDDDVENRSINSSYYDNIDSESITQEYYCNDCGCQLVDREPNEVAVALDDCRCRCGVHSRVLEDEQAERYNGEYHLAQEEDDLYSNHYFGQEVNGQYYHDDFIHPENCDCVFCDPDYN